MDKTNISRRFSESFKRAKVAEIDSGKVKISDIVRIYGVRDNSVRLWIKKYSICTQTSTRMVIELESESIKTEQLTKKVAELERVIGQKQLEIDFLNTLVEVSSKEVGLDLREVFFTKHSTD
ncbi:MAG: transposase [Arcicella sp.]|nr:transposase [Arcicella sp.]